MGCDREGVTGGTGSGERNGQKDGRVHRSKDMSWQHWIVLGSFALDILMRPLNGDKRNGLEIAIGFFYNVALILLLFWGQT